MVMATVMATATATATATVTATIDDSNNPIATRATTSA
jgi:hypothetical protein